MSSIVFIIGFNYDSNCYLINNKILVDTGAGQNKDYLFSKLRENGVEPEDIELIGIWEKEGEDEGEEEDENEEKDAATPNTGQNTKQGGNATLFVMLALPAVALMAGAGIHAKNLKKSHRKFD